MTTSQKNLKKWVMSNQKNKDQKQLEQIFSEGDAWLRKYGAISPIAHNNIVSNIYMNFPQVRYLEYDVKSEEDRILDVTVFVGLEYLVSPKHGHLLQKASELIPALKFFNSKRQEKIQEVLDLVPGMEIPIVHENVENLKSDVKFLLLEYLPNFDITVNVERHRKGMKKIQ